MSSPSTGHSLAADGGTVEAVFAIGGMTCGSCVRHVRAALEGVTGVTSAEVNLERGNARVRYAAGAVATSDLFEAVRQAGYQASEEGQLALANASPAIGRTSRVWLLRPLTAGILSAGVLTAFYIAIVTVLQGWSHALELVTGDWYFVGAIAVGFGVQVGLFVHMRRLQKLRRSRSSTALTGAGTGTSTVAMLACCAHHATDVLPLIGLSGAAVFLTDYRIPFMLLGIATNLVGIVVMLRLLRKHSALGCAT